MTIQTVTLDDKYAVEDGRIFLTGIQALVRLALEQRRADRRQGLNTAGFISGYRGSPLGGFDQQLWRAKKFLQAHDIVFQPGVNEDLGATAVWGSQQATLSPGARVDGVFGMWYGKAPGVDRTGDVFRHANAWGTSRLGGVLAIAGDDHACKSSTYPSQSEYCFMDLEMPVLSPSNVQDVLDLGLAGFGLSRFAGVWTALIALADNMDSAAVVDVSPGRVRLVTPDFALPEDGVNIRVPDVPQLQEQRMRLFKIPAAIAYARANNLNPVIFDTPNPRLVIAASGKAYADLRQALVDLGIDAAAARAMGVKLWKIGMSWPLDPVAAQEVTAGAEAILVIEEKRPLIETQLRNALYGLPDQRRPKILGKRDANGEPLLREVLDLNVGMIALALLRVLPQEAITERMRAVGAAFAAKFAEEAGLEKLHERQPWYCSGCPHNTSTKVPDGHRALGGIGCHYMVVRMDRSTDTFTQMGGEGVPWAGIQPFTDEAHIFANLGDGTYFHSGSLAIRQAVAAKLNITYKVLYNDAVAMTGGQPLDGTLTVQQLCHQLAAENVSRIVLMSEEPQRYADMTGYPAGIAVEHRDRIDAVQKELAATPGVTVLIYDQTCAAEKRRRRKRGELPDPPKRVVINELVCEGCGDCSVKSNCLSVEPVETEFGRKRRINQSSCNKDFSCTKGFCPSFVTIHDANPKPKKITLDESAFARLPEPAMASLSERAWNVIMTGIGGTGVTSVSQILGTAAHIAGLRATVLDMTGLSQKGGGVTSFLRIGPGDRPIEGPRVATGSADLLLAADMVVASYPDAVEILSTGRTAAIVNNDLVPTAGFIKNNAIRYETGAMRRRIQTAVQALADCPAESLAEKLLGDTIFANMLLLGFAWQRGLMPIPLAAIEAAITLNGAAVEKNKRAFALGRLAAHDGEALARQAGLVTVPEERPAETLDEMVVRRVRFLEGYQNAAWAERYRRMIERVMTAERERAPGRTGLAIAAARSLFKLMAYKDEYEVARLYTDGAFRRQVEAEFGQMPAKLSFHLSPPMIAPRDKDTGLPKKITLGGWMMPAFRVLASLKGLRGTAFDIFGYTAERRMERNMITAFEAVLEHIIQRLSPENHAVAVELAALPQEVKGFGHVKERNARVVAAKEAALIARFRGEEAAPAGEHRADAARAAAE